MPRPPATCHPDRPHKAFGLCSMCYRRRPEQRTKTSARQRAWRAANPEKVRQYARTNRNKHLLQTYGITDEDYARMLAAQGGGCAICGDSANRQNFAVDHDHETGKVRGLLCDRCNPALSRVEIPGWTEKAIGYLARFA